MKLIKLILELLKIYKQFKSTMDAKELADALKKARLENNTADLERIFNANKLPNKAKKKSKRKTVRCRRRKV